MSGSRSGAGWVLVGALLWSTGGVGIKLLGEGHSALAVSASRSGLCALLLILLLRGRLMRPGVPLRWIVSTSLVYAAVVTLFVAANLLTTAANAILLQYISPLWVALFVWLGGRQRPSAAQLAALALGGFGVALCAAPGLSWLSREGEVTQSLLGDLLALISGVAFAALIVMLRAMHRRTQGKAAVEPALVCLVWGNLLAFALGAPALFRDMASTTPGMRDLLVLAWLGFGQLGGGYHFFQRGLRTTSAVAASLISLVEPVLNPVWVALAVGEVPGVWTWAGGAFVLLSLVMALLAPEGPEEDQEPELPSS